MANKRMFSIDIVSSDAFLDMPTTSRELYFQLGMYADDEGFVNPKKIIRMTGASDDDLKVLIGKRFVLPFKSGVVVIKHWLIHNTIRMDRFNKTQYQDEKNSLIIKENRAYTEMATTWQPNGNQMATQVKLSKVKVSKDNLSKTIVAKPPNEENLLIQFFRETINPHLKFNNKTERQACKDLIKTYGLEKTKESLLFLEEKRKIDKFLPIITTPYELWTKWAKIKQHLTTNQRKIWKQPTKLTPSLPPQELTT